MLENLLTTSNIASIYITFMITVILFKIKYDFDQKKYYDGLLKEKLECIFNPIILAFELKSDEDDLIDDNVWEIIKSSNHQIKPNIIKALNNARTIEIKGLNNLSESDINEYIAHRQFIIKELKLERGKLYRVQERNFSKYINKHNSLLSVRIFEYLTTISKISFWMFCLTAYFTFMYYDFYEVTGKIFDSTLMNVLFIIVGFISFCMVLTGGIIYLLMIVSPCLSGYFRKKGIYAEYANVPKTGQYKCLICGEESEQYAYTEFRACEHNKFINKLKLLKIYTWKHLEPPF